MGKFIFIVILTVVSSVYFHNDNLKIKNQRSHLTFEEYAENYNTYKEEYSKDPWPLWGECLLFFIPFIIVFALYECAGALFDWGRARIRDAMEQPSHVGDRINMPMDTFIPRYLKDKVENELETGEHIQWIDMPIPQFFNPGSTAAFLFGIPWTAFALFWTAGAAWGTSHAENGPGLFSVFPLFGLPFILIGFGMLSSPIWAYRKALKTVYVITDKRAMTFEGGRSLTIRSYPPDKLQNIYRKEKKDGSGDVIIRVKAWVDSDGDRRSEGLGFLRVKNPKDVEEKLKRLAKQGENHQ